MLTLSAGRPQVLGAGGTVDVIVHSTVVLNCFSIARPVHTAKIWRKNEEVLDFSSRNGYILLPNDSLVINNATRGDDAANFSCEVINDLGDDSISFTLTLICTSNYLTVCAITCLRHMTHGTSMTIFTYACLSHF